MPMNRIVWHHSAGTYTPSDLDRQHYHRLIDGDGRLHDGLHAIADNAPGRSMAPGSYAAHTRELNTGSIGLAICAMAGADWGDPASWTHPVRPAQVSALIAETARLCGRYGIVATRRTILSHAEVEPTLGVWQRGKWDFDYSLTGGSTARDPVVVGDELRARVIEAVDYAPAAQDYPTRETIRQGSVGHFVRDAQAALGVTIDGMFGPKTRRAVVEFQARHELLPDGVVGPMTWAALL
ncbi:putative peptidoglycan binding protein [Salipiger aestuarii]|uniref:Putative peptidoglycan binding protein n=1 Tax=Salipiger aestuarii TaxID=568098 RepID=A0A327Z1K6_9RHOB|nr:peptidoglycan-binding domain-containing protein [Salipiger aestuarii]RAK24119.1 putative peptidoglycan binding protein [Salipiger aestuarii]